VAFGRLRQRSELFFQLRGEPGELLIELHGNRLTTLDGFACLRVGDSLLDRCICPPDLSWDLDRLTRCAAVMEE
jgi:hypothetical protein